MKPKKNTIDRDYLRRCKHSSAKQKLSALAAMQDLYKFAQDNLPVTKEKLGL